MRTKILLQIKTFFFKRAKCQFYTLYYRHNICVHNLVSERKPRSGTVLNFDLKKEYKKDEKLPPPQKKRRLQNAGAGGSP